VKRFDTITLDDVAARPLPGMAVPVHFRFAPDGRTLYYLTSHEESLALALTAYDLTTGVSRVIAAPAEAVSRTLAEELRRERERNLWQGITWFEVADTALLYGQGTAVRYRDAGGRVHDLPQLAGAETPTLTADGRRVVFHRDGELWLLDLPGGTPRPLTQGAEPPGLTHGMADYIAQEEFDRLEGFWISPDGRWIAYETVDQRHVPVFPIVHWEAEPVTVEEHRYPFAGQANARVALSVLALAGGAPRRLSLPELDEEGYLARVAWTPAGELAVMTVPRRQDRLVWRLFDPATGAVRELWRETNPLWVNVANDTRFFRDGSVLLTAELDGYRHLYRLSPGGHPVQLTRGPWAVTRVVDVDEAAGLVYFEATRESPLERQFYRVSLAGGTVERLSEEPGWHQVTMGPDHRWWVDRVERLDRAPTIRLHRLGEPDAVVLHQGVSAEALGLCPPELVEVPGPDGTRLYGAVYAPVGDPPAAGWPVLVSVYGGPHAQTVQNAWHLTVDLEAQYMARHGYLVFRLDNRGMAHRGLAFEQHVYRRFGTIEVDDQVAGVQWLVTHRGADPARIGVEGWSYGGFMTLTCLTKRPDVFKVGVAGAPVTDFRFYDTGYTERYMATPHDNPEGYEEASVLSHAARLRGHLLIIHGLLDENVHFRHTARLMAVLNAAGLAYEALILPESRHSVRGTATLRQVAERRTEFFRRWL
jgi:dipeptidyl-peptidase-4